MFCQWLPLYQLSQTELSIIVATFSEVFPRGSLWTPGFRLLPILGLVGTRSDPPSVSALAERGRQLAALGVRDPWLTDPVGLWAFHLGAASALDRLLGRAAPNSDARPSFDFVSGRTSLGVRSDFAGAGWPRLVAQLVELGPEAQIFPGAPRDPARGGEALAAANRLAANGRSAEAQRFLDRASRLVPARLIDSRDESVSFVWPDSTH